MASVDGSKSVLASSDDSLEVECDPCSYEGEKKEAIIYCLQCDDYLCSTCRTTHQKLSVSRTHEVVIGSAMPRKGTIKLGTSNSIVAVKCSCNFKNLSIYCKDHNDVICEDCQRLKHRTCQSMSIDDACKQVKLPHKEATLKTVQGLKETVEGLKANRSNDNEKLEIKSSECRRKIKEYSQKQKQQIEKLEKAALDEVADYEIKETKVIEQHIDTCSTALSKLGLDCQLLNSTPSTEKALLFINNIHLTKTIGHIEKALQKLKSEVIMQNIDVEGGDATII